jgi:hypothetical protein
MWAGFVRVQKINPFHDSEGKFSSADSAAWSEAGGFTAHRMALDKELKTRNVSPTSFGEAKVAFNSKMPIKEAADYTQKIRSGDY